MQVARLTADPSAAQTIADLVAETCEAASAAVALTEQKGGQWLVEITLAGTTSPGALRQLVADVAGERLAGELQFETLPARDWVKETLAGLAPVRAGRFVVHGRHDRAGVSANDIGIEIEAGPAFGTGHHGTTRGCLLALDDIRKRRKPLRILDIGTGSGVLALAAAKKSRRPVVATDIDPAAVREAKANARGNAVTPWVQVVRAPALHAHWVRARAPYDMVFANLLLGSVKLLAAPLTRMLTPRARIVLSGLLAGQADAALSTLFS
jgi:ribosomal protein L11 methyltransferase